MENLKLVNECDNNLAIKSIKVKDISHIDDFLYIILDNGQKLLANQDIIYDLSDLGYVQEILRMGNRTCLVVSSGLSICLVDLITKEILFDDKDAYSISKEDDRTLHVIKKIGGGNNIIYDIERKCYLPMPDNYEYENSLGKGLYVFVENNSNIPFYDKKRCVIDILGNFVLKDVKGWIYLNDNYLIVHKDSSLLILELDDNCKIKSVKKIEKDETILTAPEYYDGKIIIVLKDKINIYKPSLELIKSIDIEGLSVVNSSERIGDILKLAVPTIYKGEDNNKHIFINVGNGKKIEHLRINGYPYWVQNCFVGQDELDTNGYNSTLTNFYFYDKDLNFILKEKGISCYSADDENESLFIVESDNKKKLINSKNGSAKETDYEIIKYHFDAPYGYGIHADYEKMDFFDSELSVIISNFEFKKYDLNFRLGEFSYFIVNGYVCITTDFVDGYGRTNYRKIIYGNDVGVVLDSINCRCFPIGNFIQIMNGKDSQFLNTLTGEVGELSIMAYVDEKGNIDVSKIENLRKCLAGNENFMIDQDKDFHGTLKLVYVDDKKES